MKKKFSVLLLALVFSCAEKLMEKPENLISKEKMVLILNDLAIVNSAKVVNAQVLRNNDIEPTAFIFEKYSIDSIQFVESDRYYASIPEEHEEIYAAVEAKLEAKVELLAATKKLKDSLKQLEKNAKRGSTTSNVPPKNDGKKK